MISDAPLTQRFAERLSAIDARRCSRDAIHKAKLCLLDYLGCALVSTDLPWCRQALVAAAGGGAGAAAVVGTSLRASVPDAAFVNAVLGHALVRDDMHVGSVSHLGVVVMPTVLALSEQATVSGSQLIAAIIAGYEAGGRLGRSILDADVARVHRPTGIVGPFAASAAAGRLLGLRQRQYANAMALAANMSAGLNEWAATGGSEMFFQPAIAVRNALLGVALARAGAMCSPTAIEGDAGLLAAFDRQGREVTLPDSDGTEIASVFFKEVPACNYAQTPAQVARDLAVRHAIEPNEVDTVDVRVTDAAARYPGCDFSGPFEHALQAKMSIHYNVAAAICTGGFDEHSYVPAENPRICKLAALVRIEADDRLTRAYPEQQGAELIIKAAGAELRQRSPDVVPASETLVRERFIKAAGARLGGHRADELVDLIDNAEQLDDASRIVAHTTV